MSVYFITCRALNVVKIGYSENERHVRARLGGIRTCCPFDVALELIVEGGRRHEKALHRQLKAHHVRGEWFRITEEIERLIVHPPLTVERRFDEADPHARLEFIEAERWKVVRRADRMFRRSMEEKRKRLLRELAEVDEEIARQRELRLHAPTPESEVA